MTLTIIIDREGPALPSRVRSKCPATILAVKRIAKVPGRIIFLVVSIRTIKGISTGGVPCGTKCANMCTVWLIQPNTIKLSHRGKAKVNVNLKWLVLVKIYGKSPRKLLKAIIENKEIKINVIPVIEGFPINTLNSVWRVNKILFQRCENREGTNQ